MITWPNLAYASIIAMCHSCCIFNCITMIGGVIFQPLVGKLLDCHAGEIIHSSSISIYLADDFAYALSIIPISLGFAIFLSFLLKETYCNTFETEKTDLNTLLKGEIIKVASS